MEQLFKLFKTVPASEYVLDTIKFIGKYFENVAQNIARRELEAKKQLSLIKKENDRRTKSGKPPEEPGKELFADNYELYDYDILWAVVVDEAVSRPDLSIRNAAIDCLVAAISKSSPPLIENYLTRAINTISKGSEPVLLHGMEFFRRTLVFNREKQAIKDVLKIVQRDYGLFDVIFRHFNHYKSEIYEVLSGGKSNKDSLMVYVFPRNFSIVEIQAAFYA